MPFGHDGGFDVATLEVLSGAGITSAQKTTGSDLTFQVVVAYIGTNVVIRFEGSLDGDNYFNISASGEDVTITANGVYGYFMQAPVQYARVRLVSVSGGTPSVATKLGCI